MALCAASAEDTVARCTDGEDNDGNGFIDCNDFSCSQSDNPDVLALCGTPEGGGVDPEAARASCSDGIDNDGNGYVDCADYNCRNAEDAFVRQACQESVYRPEFGGIAAGAQEAAKANGFCEDGLDNDGDGYTDCADWDCSWNPLVTVCDGPKICEER